MLSPIRFLMELRRRIFHRERELFAAAGTPVILGQGLYEPRIQPRMAFHWHPPLSMMADEEIVREKGLFHAWLSKMGIRRKSA